MALSALAPNTTAGIDLRIDPSAADGLRLVEAVGSDVDAVGPACAESADTTWSETVVVHVQLRPRRTGTRRCLAALTALAARHEQVSFSLTGLSGDDRVVRVTVGVELGPRELIAKFSDEAQTAYAFVDGLFTDLYDFMPVYVAEPSAVERSAAAGVLEAAVAPRAADPLAVAPRAVAPRIPSPRTPVGESLRHAVPVPA
ncbi:hypothetical protein [Modestobacter muralis]|uniref:hypothetical protein n=1 Tax=Modestobacter muralis TaxID=1608614 RepID=UPI001B8AB5B6|nr:hypothetical protein [Modestobacter muralis]